MLDNHRTVHQAMKKIITWGLLYAVLFSSVFNPVYALGVSQPSGFGSILSSIYSGASTVGRQGLSSGVVATAAGDILVQPSGLRVPVTVVATVARGRIVAAAAACLSGVGSIIGCAATAYFAATLIHDGYGLAKCGLGYCVPSVTPATSASVVWYEPYSGGVFNSLADACAAVGSFVTPYDNPNSGVTFLRAGIEGATCTKFYFYAPNNVYLTYGISTPYQTTCGTRTDCPGIADPTKPPAPATADDLVPAIDKSAQPADLQKIYDYLKQDQSNYARTTLNPATDVTPDSTPVTVSSPATVTGPQVVTSTKTITNSDGTTSTEVTTGQTVVTPTSTGSTIGDAAMTYPSTTTVTVTNTNNTTGAVTTTSTVNNGSQSATPAPEDKGPKECGTPGKPKCQIDETGTQVWKDTSTVKQAAIDTVLNDGLGQVKSAMVPDSKTAWPFTFQLPTTCSVYPLFLGIVIDFCHYQPMIHDVMTVLWVASTTFVVIGMFGRALRG